jgi:hypothetical protein
MKNRTNHIKVTSILIVLYEKSYTQLTCYLPYNFDTLLLITFPTLLL